MYVTERVTTARREIAHNAKQKGMLPLIKFGGMLGKDIQLRFFAHFRAVTTERRVIPQPAERVCCR